MVVGEETMYGPGMVPRIEFLQQSFWILIQSSPTSTSVLFASCHREVGRPRRKAGCRGTSCKAMGTDVAAIGTRM